MNNIEKQIPLISLENAIIQRGAETLLTLPNFTVLPNQFVVVTGKMGSGKSSLMQVLYGELAVFQGVAWVLQYNLLLLNPILKSMLRRQLGLIMPRFALLEEYNLYEQLELQLHAIAWHDETAIAAAIKNATEYAEISSKNYASLATFSRRERAQAILARAIVAAPQIILADDFLQGHSEEDQIFLLHKLYHLSQNANCSVICFTQQDLWRKICPEARVYDCNDGVVSSK
jgi:cell division transport system ATP-binding protein